MRLQPRMGTVFYPKKKNSDGQYIASSKISFASSALQLHHVKTIVRPTKTNQNHNLRLSVKPIVVFGESSLYHVVSTWHGHWFSQETSHFGSVNYISPMTDPCMLLYMVLHGSHQYTPFMLALIYQHHGSVMGHGSRWNHHLMSLITSWNPWYLLAIEQSPSDIHKNPSRTAGLPGRR